MESERRPRILHLITELSTGGAQSALLRLLKGLDRNRFSLSVACLYNGDGPVADQIRRLGIPVTDLKMLSKARVDALWRLFWLFERSRATILHTWMYHANIPGRILGRLSGIPLIVSSERTMGQESAVRYWLNRNTAPLVDRFICVSRKVAGFAAQRIGLPEDKLIVIPNGVPLDDFVDLPTQIQARTAFGLPLEAKIIGAIGRARPVKGFDQLLDAFSDLAEKHPDACLLFVGGGPDIPSLKSRTSHLGLDSTVIFFDDQPSIVHMLPALDLLAVPSHYEGMSNVALEAMAAGLPVVATHVGGNAEVVSDGITGILVPRQNVTALSQAIQSLLADSNLALRMGHAGKRRIADHFNMSTTVRMTELLYNGLLAESQMR